ncbi:carboxypeptidase-like regulatory domain-containing protein [Pyxidicoccus xibeiensis]|uniref:carboxypeptidase-like regulatory domain-containing protein n=1 Tax=Pyxidicoccus xibeiensis TaxID=2906759 RepID=UPI0020A77D8B|nr:carboxypeptidase-like regulatory domain-containing protein [Pyxidicoccus xibeiensis]MCP3136907.1 carboxypeptidase regulatory-like domain-containing protein [Pyxidicoccus xibeiensis]
MRTSRWLLGLAVLGVLALLGVWLLLGSEPLQAPAPVARSEKPAPAPQTRRPSAGLRIRGTVMDERLGTPVAGARVSATWPVPGQTLSEQHCVEEVLRPDRFHPDKRLSECLERLHDVLLKRVAAREGEAPLYAEATTATDGTFVLEGLPEGPLALWALGEHGAVLRSGIPAGTDGVKLILGKGEVVEGLVEAEDDAPLAGATVTVFDARHTRFFDATSGADGHFRIGPVPPGPLVAFVSHEGKPLALAVASARPWNLHGHHALTGRVLSGGAPVQGAEVRVSRGDDLPDTRARLTPTDAQGRFTFQLPSADGYTLSASSDGRYALARVQLEGSTPPPEVVLEPGSALHVEGRVSDDGRRPVAGARVALVSPRGLHPVAETLTGEDGRYRLGPVEPGTWRFEVESRRHLASKEPLQRELTRDTGPVDLTLTRASSVAGRVTDPKGQPLPGLALSLVRPTPEGDALQDEARTDEDGRFLLRADTAGDHRIDVRESRQLRTPFPVRAPAEDVHLSLRPGAAVKGVVLDADGVPLTDCWVELQDPAQGAKPELPHPEPTDATGRFHVRGVKAGRYVLWAARAFQGLAHRTSREVDLRAGEPLEVTLKMPPERTLSGLVVDHAGRPVDRAYLQVRLPSENSPHDSRHIVTGPDGRFTVWHLTEPAYDVAVSKEGHTFSAERSKGGQRVDGADWLRVGADTAQVRLVMKRHPHVIGRLVGPDGAPLPWFQVSDRRVSGTAGAFALPIDALPRPIVLLFRARGMSPLVRQVSLRDDGRDVDLGELRMTPRLEVRGRVVDAETSLPVQGAFIRPLVKRGYNEHGDEEEVPRGGDSAADGSFKVGPLDPGPLILVVSARGRYREQRLTVEAGAKEEVTVRLDPGPRVELTVMDGQGPIPEASVRFAEDSDSVPSRIDERGPLVQDIFDSPRLGTVKEGRLVQRGLEPGPYTIVVRAPGEAESGRLRFLPQRVVLPASGAVQLTFKEVVGGATLKLRVPDGASRSVLLVQGSVRPPETAAGLFHLSREGWMSADSAGEATFHHVPEGRVTLLLRNPASPKQLHVEELDVPASGTVSRELNPVWRSLDATAF